VCARDSVGAASWLTRRGAAGGHAAGGPGGHDADQRQGQEGRRHRGRGHRQRLPRHLGAPRPRAAPPRTPALLPRPRRPAARSCRAAAPPRRPAGCRQARLRPASADGTTCTSAAAAARRRATGPWTSTTSSCCHSRRPRCVPQPRPRPARPARAARCRRAVIAGRGEARVWLRCVRGGCTARGGQPVAAVAAHGAHGLRPPGVQGDHGQGPARVRERARREPAGGGGLGASERAGRVWREGVEGGKGREGRGGAGRGGLMLRSRLPACAPASGTASCPRSSWTMATATWRASRP
jgi:hypothetical protein